MRYGGMAAESIWGIVNARPVLIKNGIIKISMVGLLIPGY